MKRPWLVMGRSNEYENGGRVGRRFSTKDRAEAFALYAYEELLWWEVRVIYSEVRR
jgi:hypothetical protein